MSLSDGRHVQIMPVLTSMTDQYAVAHWSHVGLFELANRMSDCNRRIDTTVTLE